MDGGYDGITVANANFQKERYWLNFKDHISGLSVTQNDVPGYLASTPEWGAEEDSIKPYSVSYSVPTTVGPVPKGQSTRFNQQNFNKWIGEDVANLVLYKQEEAQFENDQETLEIPNIIEFINETTQEVLDLQERIEAGKYVDVETLTRFDRYFGQQTRKNLLNARKPDGTIDIPVGISGFVQGSRF